MKTMLKEFLFVAGLLAAATNCWSDNGEDRGRAALVSELAAQRSKEAEIDRQLMDLYPRLMGEADTIANGATAFNAIPIVPMAIDAVPEGVQPAVARAIDVAQNAQDIKEAQDAYKAGDYNTMIDQAYKVVSGVATGIFVNGPSEVANAVVSAAHSWGLEGTTFLANLYEFPELVSQHDALIEQKGAVHQTILSLQQEISSLDGLGNTTQNPDSDLSQTPDKPPERDWTTLDHALEIMAQQDQAFYDIAPAQPGGVDSSASLADLRRELGDLRQQLGSSEQDVERVQNDLQLEQQKDIFAQGIGAEGSTQISIPIPPGWVPCTCPDQHPGAGIFVNGVQYHTPVLHCR